MRLEESAELICIGYSFRDNHINELIQDWINRNNTSKITIITKTGSEFAPNADWMRFCYNTSGRCEIMKVGARKAIEKLFG